MNRSAYYRELMALARNVRADHGLTTPKVTLTDMRRIYRTYGLKIDLWPHRMKKVRGAYFNDEFGARVMVDKTLPKEQRIFTMAHELKHHLADRVAVAERSDEVGSDPVEIGAEIFAAELIFPQGDFSDEMRRRDIGPAACTAEDIVRLKHDTETTLSYAALTKRAEFLGFAGKGSLPKGGWKAIEERLYGEPAYKRFVRTSKKLSQKNL